MPALSAAATVEHHPRGAFAVFADCPLNNPQVALCMVGHIVGGEFAIGKTVVPISRTITLQKGLTHIPGPNVNAYSLVAADGHSLP